MRASALCNHSIWYPFNKVSNVHLPIANALSSPPPFLLTQGCLRKAVAIRRVLRGDPSGGGVLVLLCGLAGSVTSTWGVGVSSTELCWSVFGWDYPM